MKWTENEVKKIVTLTKKGVNATEIGKLLNRSNKSIKCKLSKLGENYSKHNEKEKIVNYCVNCGDIITSKNGVKFCGHSCSATYNNKLRVDTNNCVNCGDGLRNGVKYCTRECQRDYNMVLLCKIVDEGVIVSSKRSKKYLIHKHGNKCMECGWCEVNKHSGKTPVELEHMDGNSENNDMSNLKLLCPNCHSLTPTYKALNKGNGRHKRMERYKENKSY